MSERERVRIAILGSGFAGLAMAVKLRDAGVDDFVVLEKAGAIGGTWRDNHYPGCACDVPAHLYSYSFAPNPDWSCTFAPQPEIRAYIERCADRFDVRRHVRLHAEVVAAELDEAALTWTVRCADGRVWIADVVVAATGGLSRPAVPRLPGLERFAGATWHSAAWDHGFALAGKTIASIGTGASAIQFVPHLARAAARLHVFQRTAPWVLPRDDRAFTAVEKALFRVPAIRWLYRQKLYWTLEARAVPFTLEPRILRWAQRLAIRHLHRQVADPALRATLTPDYVLGCKRILMSNDYYPALARPNVEVVTAPIREVTPRGIVTADGVERAVDAIVFGTGFDVHDYLGPTRVVGRGGRELGAEWRKSAAAHLGTTVPGFPNLFTLIGPNTGLGHNSIIVMIESQVRYVMSALRAIDRGGLAAVEPRADVAAAYNARLQRRLERTVWSTGCKSWYQDAEGKNTTLWPGSTAEFMLRTWRFDPRDHVAPSRLERTVQRLLAGAGVQSHHVDTPIARHHVYDAPGTGALPPIVFLPGLSDSASSLVPLILALRREARRVLVVEGAGHGLSAQARGAYTVEAHLASVAAALDQLLDEPAILVGNSLGGATAMRYAVDRPDRVAGLFLTSPAGARYDDAQVAELRAAFTMRTVDDARAFLGKVVHRASPLARLVAPVVLARAASPGVVDLVRTFGPEHAITDCGSIAAPIRVVWGRSERLLPPSALAYFKANLPAHATILEPAGFGHCPHLDDPARLARLIAAFSRQAAAIETPARPCSARSPRPAS